MYKNLTVLTVKSSLHFTVGLKNLTGVCRSTAKKLLFQGYRTNWIRGRDLFGKHQTCQKKKDYLLYLS